MRSWWSWRSIAAQQDNGDVESLLRDGRMEAEEGDPGLLNVGLDAYGITAGQNEGAKQTWIVNVRPDPDDIVPALLAGRPVKLLEMLGNTETTRQHVETGRR